MKSQLHRFAFFVVFIFATIFSFSPLSANASLVPCGLSADDTTTTTINESQICTICHIIVGGKNVIDWGLRIMTVIATAVIVAMAIFYIVSAGDDGMMKTAKGGIKASLIGFSVMLCAWLIVNTTLTILSVNDSGPLAGLRATAGTSMFNFTCDTTSTTVTGVLSSPSNIVIDTFTSSIPVASALYQSSINQVTIKDGTPKSVSLGSAYAQFRICSDVNCATVLQNWGRASQSIANGQFLQLRFNDSNDTTTTVNVGNASTSWTINTSSNTVAGTLVAASSTISDTFAPVMNAPINATITSTGARIQTNEPSVLVSVDPPVLGMAPSVDTSSFGLAQWVYSIYTSFFTTTNVEASSTTVQSRICEDINCLTIVHDWNTNTQEAKDGQYVFIKITDVRSGDTRVNVSINGHLAATWQIIGSDNNQYCPDGSLRAKEVVSPSTGCPQTLAPVVLYSSSMKGPFSSGPTIYTGTDKLYVRLVNVNKDVRGCMQRAGAGNCESGNDYRLMDQSRNSSSENRDVWIDDTTVISSFGPITDDLVGSFENWIKIGNEPAKKLGTVSVVLGARVTPSDTSPGTPLCWDGSPKPTNTTGPGDGCPDRGSQCASSEGPVAPPSGASNKWYPAWTGKDNPSYPKKPCHLYEKTRANSGRPLDDPNSIFLEPDWYEYREDFVFTLSGYVSRGSAWLPYMSPERIKLVKDAKVKRTSEVATICRIIETHGYKCYFPNDANSRAFQQYEDEYKTTHPEYLGYQEYIDSDQSQY